MPDEIYNWIHSLRAPVLPIGVVSVVVLSIWTIVFYNSGAKAQAYRAATAALVTGFTAALYADDPSWNVQNVLMGVAVIVSIAALVVPPLRRHARKSDLPEATHRAGHA
jgi:hypothetical protein